MMNPSELKGEIMDRKEKAIQLHDHGYNCAQAVLLAFEDKLDVDSKLLFKISEGFGAGMGSTRGTCGALSGAVMLAGLLNSDADLEHPVSKKVTYQLDREIYRIFTEKAGASICRDLKGVDTGKMLYSCEDCIRLGVEAAETVLGDRL